MSRTKLVTIVREKARKKFQASPQISTVLFGDTPSDIKAGNAAGAATIGVETGSFSKYDLRKVKADHIFKSLENTEEVLKILNQYTK